MDDDNEEDGLEVALLGALRPTGAPAGFAARVMRKAGCSPAAPRLHTWSWPVQYRWTVGALAAALLAGAGFGVEFQHRQRQEAERQFRVAMQVTSHALAQTTTNLNRAGIRFQNTGND